MSQQPLLDAIYAKVCKLEHLLTGNGTPERGIIVRVDRLEQTTKFGWKLFWLVLGTFMSTLVAIVATVLWVSR
jgi:hypothetical protein